MILNRAQIEILKSAREIARSNGNRGVANAITKVLSNAYNYRMIEKAIDLVHAKQMTADSVPFIVEFDLTEEQEMWVAQASRVGGYTAQAQAELGLALEDGRVISFLISAFTA